MLDSWLCLVLVGVVGELYIVGVGVGVGYWCWVGLIVLWFVVCLFGGFGVCMYCIGDLVCWCVDG